MIPFLIPLADVGSALTGLAKMLVGYLPQILVLVLILAGYTYMFALDDHAKASNAKRAIGVAIGGAIVVGVALTVGLDIAATITK